ncbi:nectin-2 isoform X2 [Microcaecilia unicolor]|uniref:Nectin cell adhesion molecule 3 n=1 Tax=Microcaecilia unicolor TaxID=1415580 RepID=A0A6P7YYZ0_9AMPH|nr:nectin-2 isoform X2 [Microcaecilia unicolor]
MLLVLERFIGVLLVLVAVCMAVHGQRVKVRDEVTGYLGQEVILQCIFNPGADSSIKVSQVTWVKSVNGKKVSIAVYHPTHGPSYPQEGTTGRFSFQAPTLKDASLVIRPLKMGDEGTYTCEFATYPNGNEEAETKLVLLAVPKNSAQAVPVTTNYTETTVATCISADGRPPSQITWQSSLTGNVSTSQINNTDGTVTVVSQYNIVPSSQADGQSVTCVINHKTSKEPFRIPVTLSVQYPPEVTIEGYDDNWYISRSQADLKCIAKGNPPPTNFHWSSTDGPLPSTVEVINNLLVVKMVDSLVNTSFICQVTNAVGTSSSQLKVLVRERALMQQQSNAGVIAGGVIGGILLLLLLVALVFIILKRRESNAKSSYTPKTQIFGNSATPKDFAYHEDLELDKSLKASDKGLLQQEPAHAHQEEEKYRAFLEEEERYNEVGPMLHLRSPNPRHGPYIDDDMESQNDGSMISKTAVYV